MQRLPLESLRDAVISPVICPLPTAVALIGSALFGPRRAGAPAEIRGALLARLRQRDIAVLLPLRAGERRDGSGGRPNEIVPIMPGATIDEQLDAVRVLDPERLAAGVMAASRAGHPAALWRAAVGRDPAGWLRAYTSALRRAWDVIEPVWSRSAALLDRDVERISVALARGAAAEVIARVFPYSAVAGDDLLLPSHSDRPGRVSVDGTLLLVPLVAPAESSGWTDDYGERCLAVRYSVPAAWSTLDGPPPPPPTLAALLGPQRAKVLRRLDRTVTPGELADVLHGTPSMVTHHLRALEAAGLITRTREGRNVRVARTARGTELVALYEEG
jgi:DNA-binding transcriptional ArsR family regulator